MDLKDLKDIPKCAKIFFMNRTAPAAQFINILNDPNLLKRHGAAPLSVYCTVILYINISYTELLLSFKKLPGLFTA